MVHTLRTRQLPGEARVGRLIAPVPHFDLETARAA